MAAMVLPPVSQAAWKPPGRVGLKPGGIYSHGARATVPSGTERSEPSPFNEQRKASATSVGVKCFRASPADICPYRKDQE